MSPEEQRNGAVTPELIRQFQSDANERPHTATIQNAVTNVSVDDLALNRRVLTETDHTFSNKLDDWPATNQKASGRCWLFAGLNLFRVDAMKAMNLKEFEFSQNYVLFWDKMERSNYFLEAIIDTADRDLDDRTVAHLLAQPTVDGGQWNMFVHVISKHGLVPKAFMPETDSSSNTRRLNYILNSKLRVEAARIRDMVSAGKSRGEVRKQKQQALNEVWRILTIHLGVPPDAFVWQWSDKDNAFHRDEETTPKQFAETYVIEKPNDYVCLVHDPRPDHEYGQTYTVEYLGSVVEAGPVLYLNVGIDRMKELAADTITDGSPVWFGCDMGKMVHRKLGLMDAELYEYGRIYDTQLDMDKSSRLQYHQSAMSHAMLFTGVDVLDGSPRRWRVENSWGDEVGQKGFFVMNDSWFNEHVYEVAVKTSRLTDAERAALEKPPVVLPPWDPMGALAR